MSFGSEFFCEVLFAMQMKNDVCVFSPGNWEPPNWQVGLCDSLSCHVPQAPFVLEVYCPHYPCKAPHFPLGSLLSDFLLLNAF